MRAHDIVEAIASLICGAITALTYALAIALCVLSILT